VLLAGAALAAAVGQPAPDFRLPDLQGKPVSLSDYRGKFVVLEWTNPECPFVRKHYDSANMPSLQKQYRDKGVVWLAVNSTSSSHSEFKTPREMESWLKSKGGAPQDVLFDSEGVAGRLYGAKTTPHMYVIDPRGQLLYAGAIDDTRSTNPADVKTSKNYVSAALDEALAGKPVTTASTTPYGCSVKY
jgi:peroxiredoxin